MAADQKILTRLHEFDALRAFVLLLGIVLHASLSYTPGSASFWLVPDGSTGTFTGLAFYIPHMFRMILFFLIAGLFGALLFDRLGARGYLKHRFKRLTGVLLLFWFPTLALIVFALIAGYALGGGPLIDGPPPPPPSFKPDDFPLTHLWFLWQLSLTTWCFFAARTLTDKIGLLAPAARAGRAIVAVAVRHSFGLLAAIPLAAALAFDPSWLPWFGIKTPDQQLYPTVATIAGYWLAFAIGWAMWRQPEILKILKARAPWHLAIAAATTAACLALIGVRPSLTVNGNDGQWIGYASLYAVAGWQWTLGLVGAFQRWLSREIPGIRYLSDASYWLYIAHLPLVLFFQALLVHIALPWFVKLALVLCATLGPLIIIYDLAVRPTWLGKMLNGRRLDSVLLHRWKKPSINPRIS